MIDTHSVFETSTTQKHDLEPDIDLDWIYKWQLYSPSNVAIKDGLSGKEITYKELYLRSLAGAEFLKTNYHIKKNDRVAVLATNDLAYVILFFALQRLGATLVPINYRLTVREVTHIVSDCQPKLIVHDTEFADILSPHKSTAQLLLTGPDSFSVMSDDPTFTNTAHFFAGTQDSIAMIIYTSGTTGAPKGAMLTNQMLFWNSINTTLRLNISQSDCAVVFLPFFHTGAWNVLTTPFLHRGAKVIFLNKFDASQVLQLSQDEKATLIFGVPTTMAMMTQSPLFQNIDLTSVRYAVVGGEPMPLSLIEAWHAKEIGRAHV